MNYFKIVRKSIKIFFLALEQRAQTSCTALLIIGLLKFAREYASSTLIRLLVKKTAKISFLSKIYTSKFSFLRKGTIVGVSGLFPSSLWTWVTVATVKHWARNDMVTAVSVYTRGDITPQTPTYWLIPDLQEVYKLTF